MDWSDRGLVIGLRKHGETGVILEAMTAAHGRHLGVVRGGRSRAHRAVLQPGNGVALVWRARLEEHLGAFEVEPDRLRAAALIHSPMALHGLQWLAVLLRLLPERENFSRLFAMAESLADHLGDSRRAPELMVRFELAVLAELGFGLDLERCAVSGAREQLAFVSPRSGRAVALGEAGRWADRLLVLPAFVLDSPREDAPDAQALEAGLRLTAYFLQKDLFGPRGADVSGSRDLFIKEYMRSVA
ncbi:MAG: DNA repair protein RecO [Hyphomicrobiales bacterium]|nr:DNA repair protein RecO [Hyphomicrobiales bacterium]